MTARPHHQAGVEIVDRRNRLRIVATIAVLAGLATVAVATIGLSLALFTARTDGAAQFGTKAVFPGERVTPAFQVGDSSSGTEIDRSNPLAFASDGLTATTSAWSAAFASDRYLEFDLNASLPSSLVVSASTFDLTFAAAAAGQACFYFEVRSISTGVVLDTYGSAGSPVGCVTGTTLTTFTTPISAVTTTSIANDLRVRLFGQTSDNGPTMIDLATVGGSTAYQAFTVYPVVFRDAADTTPEIVPWSLTSP
jgi:hypothetical protein